MRNQRGALEMSVGTIVIIVLAMTMLILGLVLVKSIFSGATYNVKVMDEKVKAEINKLFVENKRMVVYLSDSKLDVKQGGDWGVAWGVKNYGTPTTFSFTVAPLEIQPGCQLTMAQATDWITLGRSGSAISFPAGDLVPGYTRLLIPETAPLCLVRYKIEVKTADGQTYAQEFFDLNVEAK
ncbi:MAG: hypothetical protein AABW73_02750 [Nanoarchaeota archaeon]